ncbi:MAG: hypothetical protein M3326_14350, partial [Actinomycetota bacterium]|nr:hypothetical protein [Actinomycetota bacterium]
MELAERLTVLLEASLEFAEERDPHELLSKFLATVCRLLDARYGALFIDDAGVLTDFLQVVRERRPDRRLPRRRQPEVLAGRPDAVGDARP